MQPDRPQRRLAAIMFMDMVGFCRLSAEDDEGTLARWKSIRSDVIDRIVGRRGGRVVRVVGDQALIDHASVRDAVICAIELQQALHSLNLDLPPGARMVFRVGVHLGEVIDEGHDLFGADVNVAARLESQADPGGIVISAAVRERLGPELGVNFEDMGPLHLKNVPESVRAFRCSAGEVLQAQSDGNALRRPSIAILPLKNLTGDPDQAYLAAGLIEDVIASLARLPSLLVISRNSMARQAGADVDADRVGRMFGVRYVLSGEFDREGDRLVLRTRLQDMASGAVVMRHRQSGSMASIFALQDELTRAIIESVAPLIRAAEAERAGCERPQSIDAYDLTLRALSMLVHLSPKEFVEARGLLARAAGSDDRFATAHAWLAKWHMLRVGQGWSTAPETDNAEAGRHALAAVERDPNDPLALAIHGHVLSHARHEYDAALHGFGRALAGTPSHAMAWTCSGITYAYLGEGTKAVEHAAYGLRLSPDDAYAFYLHGALGLAHLANGDTQAAIAALSESQRLSPNFSAAARLLATAYAKTGQWDKARLAADRMMAIEPQFRVGLFRRRYAVRDLSKRDEMADLLRLAGVPE